MDLVVCADPDCPNKAEVDRLRVERDEARAEVANLAGHRRTRQRDTAIARAETAETALSEALAAQATLMHRVEAKDRAIETLKSDVQGLEEAIDQRIEDLEAMYTRAKRAEAELERLREGLSDFMSYHEPKGGVSNVPAGPFRRARALLDEAEGPEAPATQATLMHEIEAEKKEVDEARQTSIAERMARMVEVEAERGRANAAEAELALTGGINAILQERINQLKRGWSYAHDDTHRDGALAVVAAQLAVDGTDESITDRHHQPDRFDLVEKYRSDRLRQLAIAGALIAAEYDRQVRGGICRPPRGPCRQES